LFDFFPKKEDFFDGDFIFSWLVKKKKKLEKTINLLDLIGIIELFNTCTEPTPPVSPCSNYILIQSSIDPS